MTDKTMPERIWACRDKVVDIWGGTVEEGWHTEPQFDGEAEYVRTDLAAGDANEPLVDGQWRWVSVMFSSEKWQVAQVFNIGGCNSDDFVFNVGRLAYRRNLVSEIGPAIHPPANNAN